MRGIVLKDDQHDCRKGHYPEEIIPVLRTGRNIRCPVARVYEPHGDQEPRTYVLEDL
jgi:hypothetical protein